MNRRWMRAAKILFLLAAAQAWAAEPIAGTWRLKSQEIAGQKSDPDPLTLRITKSGGGYEFAYSVPVNNIQLVSMKFESRLDGSESDVKDVRGNKTGTIRVTKSNGSTYRVVLHSPSRPESSGTMAVSADGKTLTCASDTEIPGKPALHTVQIFSRE